jgi:hypothetical protein
MIKKVFRIAFCSIARWTSDWRVACLFAVMLMLLYNDFAPIISFTRITEVKTNSIIFPFYNSDPVKHLILFAGIVFLFSNAPFLDKNQPYIIIRSKRAPWIAGQIVYVIIGSALYFLIITVASLLIFMPSGKVDISDWGRIIKTLAQTDAGARVHLQFGVADKIVSYYSPIKALVYTFLLDWGAGSFLGLVIFTMSLRSNRGLGLVFSTIILFFDLLVINALPVKYLYFSPISLSRLSVIDPIGVSMYPSATYSFFFFAVSIGVFSLLSVLIARKIPIDIAPVI